MVEETVYTRTARKALEAAGGIGELAELLGCPLADVQEWLAGRAMPPDKVFLQLLEIVSRRR